ncbi:MAG TPA: class I SAM-dependent methyltransferase [Candidatus Acidoferrales bacterium]
MRYFQDARRRFRFALSNPGYAVRAVLRDLTLADERFLAAVTASTPQAIRRLVEEPWQDEKFAAQLKQAEGIFRRFHLSSAEVYAKKVLIQYAAIRAVAPGIVVETGVANGVSSAHLLLALARNNKGHLHSIEIGDASLLPPGSANGWVVPEWLRDRWTLRIGDAKTLLPEVLRGLGTIDVFIHDSLHTYDHMLWEYRAAYDHIRPGGLLISDDALWNSAFSEFAATVGARHAQILRGVGVLRKEIP